MPMDLPPVPAAVGLAVMATMAYAEGANDVSKVVATLVSSGATSYRRAIFFGAACTAVGAMAAIVVSQELAVTLTKGLMTPTAPVNETFALAALMGAMSWVLVATYMAMPVSSSHAIVGSILVLGAFAFGPEHLRWESLWWRVILPMAGSPLIALPLSLIFYVVLRSACRRRWLTGGHWLSAGAASVARGVSDAPKIVALGAFFYLTGGHDWSVVPVGFLFVVVALGMTLGSLVAGRKVTETLAERVTAIDGVEGLAANATTALLLIWASRLGLPTSTTHVISSSIVGLGMRRAVSTVRWRTVGRMALAWFVTLPSSGVLASLSYVVIHLWQDAR